MDKLVSVIIPVYNVESYLSRCLDSVLNQTYKDIEIILIDDGSTDNSLKICNKYQKKDKRIKVISNTNHGVSYTRNCGIDAAKGNYIIFIDSDDYIDNRMIEILYNSLINNDVDFSMCNICSITEKGDIIKATYNATNIVDNQEFMENIYNFDYSYGYPINKLFKRKTIGNIRFKENIHFMEDFTFICDVMRNVKNVYYCNDVLYYYVQRKNSSTHNTYSDRWLSKVDVQKYILDNYYPKFNEKCRVDFLYDYLMNAYYSYSFLKVNKKKTNEVDLIKLKKKYYNVVIKSKYTGLFKKIKLFINCNFPLLFFKLRGVKYQ